MTCPDYFKRLDYNLKPISSLYLNFRRAQLYVYEQWNRAKKSPNKDKTKRYDPPYTNKARKNSLI